ncbi:MAG: DUF6089 family protein [Salibacteraceae bacterium]
MSKRYITIFLLFSFFALPHLTEAQRWKYVRQEVFVAAGASNFMGELGGADKVGSNFVSDFEISMTRPAFSAGYRYRLLEYLSLRGQLAYARLAGNDNATNQINRRNRNLHFRSPLVELSAIGEFYFVKESTGNVYRLRGVRGGGSFNISAYAFAGISGIYFNPRGRRDGEWHSLQPLGTEGQGLPGQPGKYSRISFAIPFGLGCKYVLDRNWSIGLEYGLRKTFTDYIDDVSTNYYDNDALRLQNGDIAADLADPNLNLVGDNGDIGDGIFVTAQGQPRGDSKDKDAYMMLMFTLNYKFLKGKRNRPKF